MSSESISPTAHYTAAVWARHGLSHPALATSQGRALRLAATPLQAAGRLIGTPTLEGFLLARHRMIDRLLRAAIESGRVSQVVEVAAGMSPRGWRFAREFGERIHYVEGDLAGMAGRKRRALERAGTLGPRHRVVELDALREEGPGSLAALAAGLDADEGLAIVTEGLLNYFPRAEVEGMWRRFAGVTRRFQGGLYLSDLHVAQDGRGLGPRIFTLGLSTFVRGRVHMHFEGAGDARAALLAAGFGTAALHRGDPAEASGLPGAELVHVIEAAP